ncbi:MAG: TMEM165/GDT1 family protein [Thermoplasmata archaeon]
MVADLLAAFFLVFGVVGGFELLDRTNFALIGLSSRQPALPSWVGAASAFLSTTTLAVLIGAALLALLHGQIVYLRLAGGALLLGYAGYLWFVPSEERAAPSRRSATATAFLLIFLLELGDTTMIFTIIFVSTIGNLVLVGLAAGSALVLVAASACLIGSRVGARVEPRLLDRVVVVLLTVVGVVTIAYALEPGIFPALSG